MKSNICINVEFLAGTSFEEALIEAQEKAVLWQIAYVNFDFNGINVSVRGKSNHEDLKKALNKYEVISVKDTKTKFIIC